MNNARRASVPFSWKPFVEHIWFHSLSTAIFMPPPLGAGGIMFSGCPSVRSLKYLPSTCRRVHPTKRDRFAARPSVRPERFPGICRRMHWGNGLKFCMLMYLDHRQTWLGYGHRLLIFLLLVPLWLSETSQIWGFRAFPEERMGGMAWKFACWCSLTTSRTD